MSARSPNARPGAAARQVATTAVLPPLIDGRNRGSAPDAGGPPVGRVESAAAGTPSRSLATIASRR